ncbi:hypothetical protein EV127DRAFT_426953 [Xylaria flabelliformis]|nr:hypothetical protein EV127DRAFT_426953 [Xylaria flabelliformis]
MIVMSFTTFYSAFAVRAASGVDSTLSQTADEPQLDREVIPQWMRTTSTAGPTTREKSLNLPHGHTHTIREARFSSPEQSFAQKKESHKPAPYRHYTVPILEKIGVAQFDHQAQAAVDSATIVYLNNSNLCDHRPPPLARDESNPREIVYWSSCRACDHAKIW